jgi:SpoIID/LytB domain protein
MKSSIFTRGIRKTVIPLFSRKKLITASVITLLLSLTFILPGSSDSTEKGGVKINILTKQFRLLKEGRINSIRLNFESNMEIQINEERIKSDHILFLYRNSRITASIGSADVTGKDLIINASEAGTFTAEAGDFKASYPLPLAIKYNEVPELIVTERIERYAADSAFAELGSSSPKHREAIYALAEIIRLRYILRSGNHKNSDYDFCDLTCCQVYRGITGTPHDFRGVLKSSSREGIFFHSSSGGRLFTESVFNRMGRSTAPPEDIIYSESFRLSSNSHMNWQAYLTSAELSNILFPAENVIIEKISYKPDMEIIEIQLQKKSIQESPESFRIKVNRVKGWNFIKSNNYTVSRRGDGLIFSGDGLGHGTGMSLEGAMELAERGYTRYEIIEHYLPRLQAEPVQNQNVSPYTDYILFDLKSGKIIETSQTDSFLHRIVPAGSIFKLLTSLYLASERPDLFSNHHFTCEGGIRAEGSVQCWSREGHGRLNLQSALPLSCNAWFGSLAKHIDADHFRKFTHNLADQLNINISVSAASSTKHFSEILCGLDFKVNMEIKDIMTLAMLLTPGSSENENILKVKKSFPPGHIDLISRSLYDTFHIGTARYSGSAIDSAGKDLNMERLWGKTSTFIAGTNSHHGYGMFLGGYENTGIFVVKRKGSGSECADEGIRIINNFINK